MKLLAYILIISSSIAAYSAWGKTEQGSSSTHDEDGGAYSFLDGISKGKGAKEYKDLSNALQEFEEQGKEFQREIQLLVEKKHGEKKKSLEASYEKAITDIEAIERGERRDAIAMFEEFLKRYPNDSRFTPDIIFRLAELYYEKTKDDFSQAMKKYEEQLLMVEQDKHAVAPPEPTQDFQKSIALYNRLLEQFPKYKLNDGTYYLLGFCLEKQGAQEKSINTYEKLIAKYPRSKFVPEAWLRLGEYYFDAVDEPRALDKAAEAYSQAANNKDHPLYDKALYKLGWTYFRKDSFDKAVRTFVNLIDFYDQRSKEAGEEAGGDLREEAFQYMAISLADEKWGSVSRTKAMFSKLGSRPWEAEIWKRLGDVYSDQTKWDEAIAAYQQYLAKDQFNPNAPQIQDKIVKAYEQGLRDFERAYIERDKLVKMYSPGTSWYEKNKSNSEVIRTAQELAERGIYSAAVYHHQQAIQYVKNERIDEAKREFEIAARGYADYLKRFPHSKLAYELQYYMAECLYSSLQFVAAAKSYEAVRDSTADHKYQGDAAYAAVLSYIKEIEFQQKSKPPKLETRPLITSKDRPESRPIKKESLPEIWKQFVQAADTFVRLQPKHNRAPQIAYRAAEIFYCYDDFEEARRRFAFIAENYPHSEFAKYSSNLTLETFLVSKDWVAVTEYTNRLTTPDSTGTAKIDPHSENGKILRGFGDNAMFKQAEKLMDEKKWDEAAKLYEDLVRRNRSYEYADKALNNAAVCRENARRFDSALRLYERIYSEYPNSSLADVALFRVAVNAENSYDFKKAINRYRLLVKKYPNFKDRSAALNNLARLLEALQQYPEAAQEYARHAETFPKDEDAPKNLYRVAIVYEKMGDCRKQISALEDFIKKYSRNLKQSEQVVDAYRRIGDCQRRLKNEKKAKEAWISAAREYRKRGLGAKDELASSASSYAQFQLAEFDYRDWDKIKLQGRGKALERAFRSKLVQAKKLQNSYSSTYKYKNIEWILAASYKKGYVLERFATTLVESPCPIDIKRQYGAEGCDVYRQTLVDKVTGLEEKAADAYESTLKECRKYQLVDNEWCDRTQDSLARLRSEFKVPKKARSVTVSSAYFPAPLVESFEGPLKKPASSGKLSEEKE